MEEEEGDVAEGERNPFIIVLVLLSLSSAKRTVLARIPLVGALALLLILIDDDEIKEEGEARSS